MYLVDALTKINSQIILWDFDYDWSLAWDLSFFLFVCLLGLELGGLREAQITSGVIINFIKIRSIVLIKMIGLLVIVPMHGRLFS